jgi:nucleoside-diphosphate-sugar epimerase
VPDTAAFREMVSQLPGRIDLQESFTPEELAAEIRTHEPDFTISYDVDPVRQKIADSWPNYMDDSAAREEWGWKPEYDLSAMTSDMLDKLRKKPTLDGKTSVARGR